MIEAASPRTLHMAVLIGLICLASGMAAMFAPADAPEAIEELERSPAFGLSAAFLAILFGAFVIHFHRSWGDSLAILVSVVGWVAFIEGLVLLGLPHLYVRIARPVMRHARAWGLFALVLGAFLIAGGLTARHPHT